MSERSDMAVFVKVVEQRSMTKAGRELRMTAGAVTKRIAKLEARLGVRLLNRTTRSVSTTEAGAEFFGKSKQILRDIRWLEASVATFSDTPTGMLKISAPSLFGRRHISPLLPDFSAGFPDIRVHLQLTDRNVDLQKEGFDIAIRSSDQIDASLVVRYLAEDRRVVCGAPAYFEEHGMPDTPQDLLDHNCLMLRFPGSKRYRWHFSTDGQETSFLVKGTMDSNSSEVLREWAIAGVGVSMLSTAEVADEIRAGKLTPVLVNHLPQPASYKLVFPKRELMPSKTRAFVDFVSTRIKRIPYWDLDLEF